MLEMGILSTGLFSNVYSLFKTDQSYVPGLLTIYGALLIK